MLLHAALPKKLGAIPAFCYLMTLLIGAWSGRGPGLAVVALMLTVVQYIFKPGFSIKQLDPAAAAVFIVLGLIISAVSASRRRKEQMLRSMNDDLDARVREQTEAIQRESEKLEQTAEALRVTDRQLRSFLTQIPGTTFIKTAEGRYLFRNPPVPELAAASDGSAGPTDYDLWPAEQAEQFRASDQDVLAAGKPIQRVERGLVEGKTRYWLVTKFLMQGPSGATLIAGTSFDITESKALEEQLQQSRKMEAIGQLAGGVAHDFNNLLTVINGYSALLLGEAKDARMKSKLQNIQEAGNKAAELTRQLLAFSRKQMLQPRTVDVNELLTKLSGMLERLIPESIEVKVGLDPRLCSIHVDPTQVEQVLLNLIVNARDAMSAGGQLTLETSNTVLDAEYAAHHPGVQPGDYVMISVTDTGVGIPKEIQASVFEPFFTTKEEGTGLGLATVYGIVKQSEGHVYLYSEPGVGTTFKIYFPATSAKARRAEESRAGAAGGSEVLLLVEDDTHVRGFCEMILADAGYTVQSAATPEEAMALLETKRQIDLLITDVVMPRMNGPELARRIREARASTRVLFVSGYTENTVARHGVLNDEANFLPKPYTREQLLTSVRQALTRS